jgi:hypothetical protein
MTGNENAKWSSIINTKPGGTRLVSPKSWAMPSGLLQNSNIEYPKATVGTTNGISARLSRIVAQYPRFLTMSHARGMPAKMSRLDTTNPITKDHVIALFILVRTLALTVQLGRESN